MYTIEGFRGRVKEIRTKSRWKVRELSYALGKKAQYISDFEKGKEDMSVEDFLAVCQILQISPKLFFVDEGLEEGIAYEILKKRTEELPDKVRQFLRWYFSLKRR